MSEQPVSYPYLLELFTVPDMRTFLTNASITDDVYALPIHLQRLISEAKEELVIARTKEEAGTPWDDPRHFRAIERLERLRSSIWVQAGHDASNLISVVTELIRDDDELQHVLGE
ncbi:hypothetical protein BX666DRAFT_1852182 [Dichotomocladium elegans]|nr:hypothetical protein BX666DRAFT_1852182 [Dichotomocladium elegans]